MRHAARICILKQQRDFVIVYHWYQLEDGTIIIVHIEAACNNIL